MAEAVWRNSGGAIGEAPTFSHQREKVGTALVLTADISDLTDSGRISCLVAILSRVLRTASSPRPFG
ncbi:MAG: hypothetical protein JWO91_2955, partial [Acidobacteriaceae bacterium]|nr:hypothetical protein [Acidobacteriaceae bacterium]